MGAGAYRAGCQRPAAPTVRADLVETATARIAPSRPVR